MSLIQQEQARAEAGAGYLSGALQVLSGHWEGGHKHGKAAEQEHSAHQTTEPSQEDRPVNRATKGEVRDTPNSEASNAFLETEEKPSL